jgi:hypothetical protein
MALTLEVDGELVHRELVTTADLLQASATPFYLEHDVEPGEHRLRLVLADESADTTFVLFDAIVPLQEGQIFRYGQ